MRTLTTLAVLGLAVALAVPAGATGGSASFRVLAQGDLIAVAISSFCPGEYPEPTPVDPDTGLPFPSTCWVIKTNLGYDGLTGAAWDSTGHLEHSFQCAVTSSATPGVESITVGFDRDGDTFIDNDAGFPNTVWRPLDETGLMPGGLDPDDNPTGVPDVDDQIPNSVNPGLKDGFLVTAVIRGQFWPVVDGTILGDFAVIFLHAGADASIDCSY